MRPLVIDASVVLKWLLAEPEAASALLLRRQYHLIAPELILLECASTFWKRVRRRQLSVEEALMLVEAIPLAGIEIISMQSEARAITDLALELDHPAYDCAYIVLAQSRQCRFATADTRLVTAIGRAARNDLKNVVVAFTDLVQ
ncbi:MAG: type II toxin-antitoxin system VapC family toxin [Pseudorhodoplanes sp.]|uniref:type II toxin-antitoxin system VapC family toxin n=1 Tax=Pseudorhodoplanes sp. TaxID=1934341 RepID=UPI003D13E1F8